MANRQNVEFKTMDGITLRGDLYSAGQRGPAVILTPGVSPFGIGKPGMRSVPDIIQVQLHQRDVCA